MPRLSATLPHVRIAQVHDLLAQRRRRSGSRTSSRQRSISRRMSDAVAPPSLTMKLACSGETRAPPIAQPFSPARSMSAPADGGIPSGTRSTAGSGFWKMQPALGRCSGCVRLRSASDRRAVSRSAAGVAAGVSANSADRRTSPVRCSRLRVVGELHLGRRHVRDHAARRRRAAPTRRVRRSTARRSARCRRRRRRPCPACPPTPRARPGRGRSSTAPARSSVTPASARTPASPSRPIAPPRTRMTTPRIPRRSPGRSNRRRAS